MYKVFIFSKFKLDKISSTSSYSLYSQSNPNFYKIAYDFLIKGIIFSLLILWGLKNNFFNGGKLFN